MDRKVLREYTHRAASFLTLDNSTYKQWVFRYTFLELEKDLGTKGDITTNAIFTEPKRVKAKVVAKGDGVFAGVEEAKYFLVEGDVKFRPRASGEFVLDFRVQDGQEFKKGDVLLEIEAEVHDLLAVERVLLNLLMRMSGVATFTRKIVGMVGDKEILITPTRKALWGLLDKKAVVLGGGGTHRLGLFDAILIKDTHLDALDRNFEAVFEKVATAKNDPRFVEIEVERVDEVVKVCEIFGRFLGDKIRSVGVILMDNMNAEQMKEAMRLVSEAGFDEKFLFEASGGINEGNVMEYAEVGADIISMGSLTSGVKSVDMSLKVG